MTSPGLSDGGHTLATPWITSSPQPPDFGGPIDIPYKPIGVEPGEAHDPLVWLRRSAETWPFKVAIADDRLALTYRELIDRIDGLSRRIAEATASEDAIAYVIDSGTASAVALLAAIAAGRVIAPIDAGHPLDRQSAILKSSGARVVIVDGTQTADISFIPPDVPVITFDPSAPTGSLCSPTVRRSDGAAVIVFTSGTSGSPKGVAHPLRLISIARFVERHHLNEHDAFISLASMSQTGVADLMGLAVGGVVHVVDIRRRGIFEALRVMREEKISFLSFVPSFLRPLLSLPGLSEAVANLRILDLHGEAILRADVEALRTKLPSNCHISVTYGSTEAGAVFSWFVLDGAIRGDTAPIGYLARGKAIALLPLNDAVSRAPAEGELLVKGSMALGSWEKGHLQPGRFLSDPDSDDGRIYAMGDIVRLRADGLAEFVGRQDRQVKVRGLWVDLGLVEATLRECDNVLDAVALLRVREDEADEVAAFVVPDSRDAALDVVALRRTVQVKAAEHMAPSQIHFIEAIPRLANYKPDLIRLQGMLA